MKPDETFAEYLTRWCADHPEPADDAVSRLQHTLDAFPGEPADGFAIVATGNIYGDGVMTGVTWGDLRTIAELLSQGQLSDEGRRELR